MAAGAVAESTPADAAGEARPGYRLAVDVGGTFTDVVIADGRGRGLTGAKVPTTPHDRAVGVMEGVRAAAAAEGIGLDSIAEVVHGSTTGTNALIERSGAKVGFLTTAGFRDMLEIGRVQRPMEGLYDFTVDRPPPLVPRHRCVEAVERIDAEGRIVTPLDEASVAAAAEIFAGQQVEAVAVCFLFAHLNPGHEDRAAEILAERLPGVPISVSNRMSPEYREYERASTAVMNAYLTPVMDSYLGNLEARIGEAADGARLSVIQANGGSTSVEQARRKAVTTVNSGPCGGVVAAALYGRRHGRSRMVSVDMGGTSFDIGLIEEGRSRVTTEGDFQGLPVKIPIIDLHIIGAGGGSVAWIDPGGALNVGPHSAGAVPGPACYGQGGAEATVTDANLVLGRLDPANFLGGEMALDVDAARRVIRRLAGQVRLDEAEAAEGVVTILNSNMANAIRMQTVQKGLDPRGFSLVALGGAGPLHAAEVAAMLDIPKVIVPPHPGITSAAGLLTTDLKYDAVKTAFQTSDSVDAAKLNADFAWLADTLIAQFAADDLGSDRIGLIRAGDLRYVGQGYELRVAFPDGPIDEAALAGVWQAFERQHRTEYGHVFADSPIEIVNIRLTGTAIMPKIGRPPPIDTGELDAARLRIGSCSFRVDGGLASFDTPYYRRDAIPAGRPIEGPAVVVQRDTTTVVPPGWTAVAESNRNLILKHGA